MQTDDVKILKKDSLEEYNDLYNVFYYHDPLYILKILYFKTINCQYDDSLAANIGIKQTKNLFIRKYF